jgi:hypothetical protein
MELIPQLGIALWGRGRQVLLKLSKEIGECYRLAAEARENASAATDAVIRQDFLEMERRLLLAHS